MPGTRSEPNLRGRGTELGELEQVVDRAVGGSLSVAVLEGEAGIGKTRMLTEAMWMAETHGFGVCRAKAEEMEQARPFGVIAHAMGCVRGAADPRRAAIATLLHSHHGDAQGPVTVSSDPGLRFRAVDALCDLVEELALQRPLLIALDDLHWADPSSLLTLDTLTRTALGLPVAVIGCFRPVPRSQTLTGLLRSVDDAGGRRIHLNALQERDVYAVVAETVAAEPGPDLLAEVAGAAGNPLFVHELLNEIEKEGGLHTENGRAEVSEVSLPPSLRLTILRGISSLPEESLLVLRAGALLGSTFQITELAAVMARPVAALTPGVQSAITAGVLAEEGSRLRFRHDVIHQAVYSDMPSSLRLGLHREAGQRLAAIGAPAFRVAEQFTRGAQTGDEEAIDWLTRAARQAVSGSPETGAELLQGAMALMPRADPRRDVLLTERADALMLDGRVADAAAECRSLLARPHRREADAPARLRLGSALLVNGWPADARRELEVVARSPASTEAQRIGSLGEVGTARLWLGDFDGAATAAEQAYPTAVRIGDHRAATEAMATLSVVACLRGQMAQALKASDEALELAENSPDRVGHGYPVYSTRAWILMELDQSAQARQALSTGIRICEDLGVRWPLATYQTFQALVGFISGEWDDVVAEMEAAIGLAEETGVTYALKPSFSAQAMVRLHRNDLRGARQAIDKAVAIGERGSRLFDYRVLKGQALLLEAEGDTAGAFTTLSERWQLCQDAGMALDYPVVGPDLVRLAREVGDLGFASEVAASVNAVAAANQVPSITGAALRCRGLLTDDADAMLRAIDAYADSPRRLEWALTCQEAAELEVRHGHPDAARSLLQRAGEGFDRLEATRGLVRVDATLRSLGVRRGRRGPRRRPRWGWGSLTPTERTVADLVAEGMSNPQIAGRLYVSRRTVQTHVSHIFAKLQIGSRVELAAQVTRQREVDAQPASAPGLRRTPPD